MKNFEFFFQQLSEIKEVWEIYQIFENERKKFLEETKEYNAEIQAHQDILRGYRQQIKEIKQELEELRQLKQEEEEALRNLKDKKTKQRIDNMVHALASEKENIKDKKKQILPNTLKEVQVYTQDNKVQKMKPAQNLYGEELYKKYRVALKESRELKNKIADLELENLQLNIEIRDFYAEIALQEQDKGSK